MAVTSGGFRSDLECVAARELDVNRQTALDRERDEGRIAMKMAEMRYPTAACR